MNLKRRYLALLLVGAMVLGAVGTYAGFQLFQPGTSQAQVDKEDDQEKKDQEKQKTIENLLSGLQKKNDEELSKVNKAYSLIKEKYVQDVDSKQLIEGAIDGMLQTLDDPYSTYMDQETVEQFESTISSSFEGIGTEVSLIDGKVTIVSPFKGSPAEKAGLKPKDQIVGVDGENIVGMDLYDAVLKIRGEKGTTVTLEINRPGVRENLTIDVVRDTIPIETVYSDVKTIDGKKAGVLEITSFAEDTATDFNKKLAELEKKNIEGLVIDVRGNPGGLFTSAQKILENFIPKDEPYVQIANSSGEKQRYFSSLKEKKGYPVVVLIDEGSASASEILASAMKEAGEYDLVGKQSFGKGTVQQPIPMGDGSNLKLTIYKWLTPDGNWIHKKGIKPTVKAELPEYYYTNPVQIDKELKYDQNSEKIANVQKMLEGLGFNPGRKDGYFSRETAAAVKNFQQEQGLEVTGTVNEKTGTQLQSAVVQKVQNNENDTQMKKALEVLFKGQN
ncbi:S41 family peptidase [Pontibacillus marinus]|uniref:C-terminal processing peptidase n=1 Tax=Pontibacillus marinus BH030004 = DSM 16465 TaxID=1385511 RepID=A0A0A5G6M5_9BACI|nr:S41 family peptidase [Pontibacillus marinus]KGX86823.1 peptidase S41 [Pontibacillus marinus BH030004 = DSM 16465]